MDCPDVDIFNGATLGTIKEDPPFLMQFHKSQLIPPVHQVLRTFIPSKAKRHDILGYLENGLPIRVFLILCNFLKHLLWLIISKQEVLWMIVMLLLGTAI